MTIKPALPHRIHIPASLQDAVETDHIEGVDDSRNITAEEISTMEDLFSRDTHPQRLFTIENWLQVSILKDAALHRQDVAEEMSLYDEGDSDYKKEARDMRVFLRRLPSYYPKEQHNE